MNHLLKKLKLAGGKRQAPQAEPAVLQPPIIGYQNLVASYSYVETIDLISDGPIGGLVNNDGLYLNDIAILQGVFLDNTPIATSNNTLAKSQNKVVSDSSDKPNFSFNVPNIKDQYFNLINENLIGDFAVNSLDKLKDSSTTLVGTSSELTLLNSYAQISWQPWFANPKISNSFDTFANTASIFRNNYVNLKRIGAVDICQRNFNSLPNASFLFNNNWLGRNFIFSGKYQDFTVSDSTDNSYVKKYFIDYIWPHFSKVVNKFQNGNGFEKNYADKFLRRYVNGDISSYQTPDQWISNLVFYQWIIANPTIGFSYIVCPITSFTPDSSYKSMKANDIAESYETRECQACFVDSNESALDSNIASYVVPTIDSNGDLTGELNGCIIIIHVLANTRSAASVKSDSYNIIFYTQTSAWSAANLRAYLNNIKAFRFRVSSQYLNSATTNQIYNFANILCENQLGEEKQTPLKYFNKIFIDKYYQSQLLGSYNPNNELTRIQQDPNVVREPKNNVILNGSLGVFNTSEGSKDGLGGGKYSNWNISKNAFTEKAIPINHIVDNPNIGKFFVTFQIDSLHDTLIASTTAIVPLTQADPNKNTTQIPLGTNYSAVLSVQIECGLINDNGEYQSPSITKQFQFIALIQSQTMIDIGNPDIADSAGEYQKFIFTNDGNNDISVPFELPQISNLYNNEQSQIKRYIRVTKLSPETSSTLVRRDISLVKITEIIDSNLTYPYSAIVGTKIDSRSFGSVPIRTYHCKLKKVSIPSNYFPCDAYGADKRYIKQSSQYVLPSINDKSLLVYNSADWDGTFRTDWTDNPAWILYDLLTNNRYGLGQYLDSTQINIWDLYRIGRFCDSVDEYGRFIGVSDGNGGLEPRYSCNILFNQSEKIFDAINIVASLFRGMVYYYNSEMSFIDDQPKLTSCLFTNSNVKDGFFNYSNYQRDQQFNSVEVVYVDRFSNFLTKVELVENEEDIRKRGVFKTTINAMGVTSRAMARRMGQHLIYQTINENQSISFTAGLESLLCRPGDLIIIEDELKSLKSNFGRVLSVDTFKKSITLNEKFNSDYYNGLLTIYTPTGRFNLETFNNDEILINTNYSNITGQKQITTYQVTGIIENDYGCEVLVDSANINSSLLSIIPLGSAYRFQIKNSDDQIFKVVSIKEDNPNEYLIVANKYNTGKYEYIENLKSIETQANTMSYQVLQNVNGRQISILNKPTISILNTGNYNNNFYISGGWNQATDYIYSTGYHVELLCPNGVILEQDVSKTTTGARFDIDGIGNYVFKVQARGNPSANTTSRFDSNYDSSGVFLIYDSSSSIYYDRSFIKNIYID
jgi:hypothetical protein